MPRPWRLSPPGAHWGQPDGQVVFMLILTVAAAEVAVGSGLGASSSEAL